MDYEPDDHTTFPMRGILLGGAIGGILWAIMMVVVFVVLIAHH